MIRTRLVVEGNIQGVSYRALVKQIARGLGIKGLVRNLGDGGVEIFCECNKEVLQNFVKMIDRKGDPGEPFSLNVEKINIYNEGEKGYVNPPAQFKTFEVDYKIKLNPFQKESIEKSEIGGLVLVDTRDEVRGSREDIKGVRDEVKGSREDVKAMHQDMNKRFDWVAEKYGDIGAGIISIKDDLKELKNMGNDVKEMKNLFAKLVNHIVKEK
ncbi:MAG: acylphosphatase [Thermoplasmatales archaeon]|nr:acylphosphatase [Thermoplasmatales archaeon]